MKGKDNKCVNSLKSTHVFSTWQTKILLNFQDCFDLQLSVLIGAGLDVGRRNFAIILGMYQVIM